MGELGVLKRVMPSLAKLPKVVVLGLSLALMVVLGVINYSLVPNLSLLLFYLGPVAIATWWVGVRPGFIMAGLTAIATFWSQRASNLNVFLGSSLWHAIMAGLIGIVAAQVLYRLKTSDEIEKQLSRTDAATGAINRHFFLELLEAEYHRAERYRFALTLAYMSLNNLKLLNERLGHQASDELLYQFIDQFSQGLRSNDVVARLSNDEFALLLPQTNEFQAQQVFARLQNQVKQTMESETDDLEYKMAVVTFLEMPDNLEELTGQPEALLKRIKVSGKTDLDYQVFP